MKFPFLFSLVLCGTTAHGITVAELNQAAQPPLISGKAEACSIALSFKPALIDAIDDMHGYLVVTRPDGKKTEVRGGPSKFDVGVSPSAGLSGNPFSCAEDGKWGVVVPYVGPHGNLGKDDKGKDVFSPDGNVSSPKGVTDIRKSADGKKPCVLANCVMKVMSIAGRSCLPYTAGIADLRNSNTIISFALATCGVEDPLPQGISASGWGGSWLKPK